MRGKRARIKWFVNTGNIPERNGKTRRFIDLCDSKNIEQYIRDEYHKYQPKTTFIAYGTPSYSEPVFLLLVKCIRSLISERKLLSY